MIVIVNSNSELYQQRENDERWPIETKQESVGACREWGPRRVYVHLEKREEDVKESQDVYFPTCSLFGLKTQRISPLPYTSSICMCACVYITNAVVYITKTPTQDSISW